MKKITILVLIFSIFQGIAQKTIQRDPVIEEMVAQISSDSLKAHINKLVTFGTRSTLSTTTDAKKGIGAARKWVLGRFQEFAKNSEGRMTAKIENWMLKPDGKRVDKEQEIGNVMGILKGTDPTDDRIFLVSGHIDSRNSNVMDREKDAPGANDDGSGTAVVIELARIMSKTKFPATVIFLVVRSFETAKRKLSRQEVMAEAATDPVMAQQQLLIDSIDRLNNTVSSKI